MVVKQQLINDLQSIGMQSGDCVLVHGSLSRIGTVDGGPEAVIAALLAVLGDTGTLLMPSFQGGSQYELLSQGLCFDVRTTPSELGIISECFRQMPGVQRSLNPTHSVAGFGAKADEILHGHQYCRLSTGHGTPFEKNALAGGKILLLGVDHRSNTTLHHVENINGAPALSSQLFQAEVVDEKGQHHVVELYSHMPPGLKRHYSRVESILLAAGAQKNVDIGAAESRLIDAAAMIDIIGAQVRADPMFLIEAFRVTTDE
ncbi:MAG: AAC(3) family N-acetyltransferase [Planctomycetes bacterium]|nr:AAC(3) family N-acetyltransferase [Planctomycetota bacterium]